MVINALFPVIALMAVGAGIKRLHLLDTSFFSNSDKLVYYVLFPILLFWKIGGAPLEGEENWQYLTASALAVSAVFLLSILFIRLYPVASFKAGSFNQSCYRFNTYIGMAVVINLFGEKGVQLFSILVGLLIPCINVMSVSVLVWHSGKNESVARRLVSAFRKLLVNPLIIGCVAGLLYAWAVGDFPQYIDNSLQLMASTTLPLALFSIGAAISLACVKDNIVLAVVGAGFKLVALPLLGYVFLFLLGVHGLAWKVSMLFFSLPTSTAIYVLSSQLNSDTELASAAIALSTLFAFVSMSVVIGVIVY